MRLRRSVICDGGSRSQLSLGPECVKLTHSVLIVCRAAPIQVLASLNHPNIATIYGVEERGAFGLERRCA
jgi:hypothetical protein